MSQWGCAAKGQKPLPAQPFHVSKPMRGKEIFLMENKTLEVVRPRGARRSFRYAVFDFDGTLSLIREGWQGIMIPYFADELAAAPGAAASSSAK